MDFEFSSTVGLPSYNFILVQYRYKCYMFSEIHKTGIRMTCTLPSNVSGQLDSLVAHICYPTRMFNSSI